MGDGRGEGGGERRGRGEGEKKVGEVGGEGRAEGFSKSSANSNWLASTKNYNRNAGLAPVEIYLSTSVPYHYPV